MGYSDNILSFSTFNVDNSSEAYDHTLEWLISTFVILLNLILGLVVNFFFPGLKNILLSIIPERLRPYVAPFIIIVAIVIFAFIQPRILRTLNVADVARRTIERQRQIEQEPLRLQRENIRLQEVISQQAIDGEREVHSDSQSFNSCEE